MASTLEVKIIAGIAAYAPLTALLGNPPRLYEPQLSQQATFPAMIFQTISNPREYSFTDRMVTSWSRVQFRIWGGQFAAGNQAADQVRAALLTFLDQFNAIGISGLSQYPCRVVGDFRGNFLQTETLIYQRVLDVMIFSNESF